MLCNIHWNTLTFSEWEQRFKRLKRANLLQSYPYARAMCEMHNQRARFGLIHIDEQEAGMVQILEIGILKNLIHAVILDRGPLWFDNFGSFEHFQSFLNAFNQEFPARIGRKRRIIPEIEHSDAVLEALQAAKFKKQSSKGYETIWLDLTQDPEMLRGALKKNWRGTLNKAEKADLTLEWDDKGVHFAWLMEHYAKDRAAKGYDGPSLKLLQHLRKYFAPSGNIMIGRALHGVKPIAGVLILTHGTGATYQIGYASEDGRKYGAHHALLWDALHVLKQRNIQDFDLGGINDETAKGVQQFKMGMGGEIAHLPGLFT